MTNTANAPRVHSPLTGRETAAAVAYAVYRKVREALEAHPHFTHHTTFVGLEFVAGVKVKGWMRKEIKVAVVSAEGGREGEEVSVEASAVQGPVRNPDTVRAEMRETPRPSGESLTDLLAQSADYGGTAEDIHEHAKAVAEAMKKPEPTPFEGGPAISHIRTDSGTSGVASVEKGSPDEQDTPAEAAAPPAEPAAVAQAAPQFEMRPVESTRFKALGHDGAKTLRVEFAAGEVVDYDGVDADTYSKLRAASSPGKFFERHVRHLPHRRVG